MVEGQSKQVIDDVNRLRLTMFDAGLHTLVVEYGLSLWTHTISLLLPLMASHAGGSWSGLFLVSPPLLPTRFATS